MPLVILSFSTLVFSPVLFADTVEYKIKAGYLYNFTKFITWPTDQSATFNLCIVGDDPFGEAIDPIEQRTAFEKPIKLFRLDDTNALRSASKSTLCHILFISSSIVGIPSLDDGAKNVLIVGESEGFARHGGMIGFITEDSRIKLQINWQALKRSDLKISAKLLEVAEIIEGDAHD